MKKLLVLVTIMVAVFGFSAGAFSQTVCEQCKCTLRNVDCPSAVGQGGVCAVTEFDYDSGLGAGFCGGATGPNCRLIFEVCNCALAANFIPGYGPVGVKMTILVNGNAGANGAYWSGGAIPVAITGQAETTYANACALAGSGLALNFGAPSYWLSDGSTASAPLAGAACTVPAANRATILTTPVGQVVLAGMGPYWRIDVPPMRIDPAVIPAGAVISVRVDLYLTAAPVPICPTCVGCICSCTINVATACCSAAAATTTLTFNYFTRLNAGDYWNGLSISNPTATAGTCALTARQQNGTAATANITVPANGMFVDLLENMTWTGTVTGTPAWIRAVCTYGGAFGFAMMSNANADSMGYLGWTVLP